MFIILLIFGAGFWFGKQNAGQQQKILKERFDNVSDSLTERIESMKDLDCLNQLLQQAIVSNNIDDFRQKISFQK